MQSTDVHKLIAQSRLFSEGQAFNILSQHSSQCKSGKWLVGDDIYPQFLETIHAVLEKTPSKQMHFMEKPNEKFNMIKLDVDLRFAATEDEIKERTNLTRRYNEEFIELLVNCLKDNIEKIIDIKESFNIYIQEKKHPKITIENTIKDGIHIIIPDLVLNNVALFHLRDCIVEDEHMQEIIKDIDNLTKVEDVIDKRIIYPNAWYIYGCGKPEDYGDFYKITKTYKVMKKGNTTTLKKIGLSSKTLLENIKMFSNFGKVHNVEYLIDFEGNDLNAKYGDNPVAPKSFGKQDKINMLRNYTLNQANFRRISNLNRDEINAILNCLKKTRADDYADWRRVGLSLYNMDDRNFEIWNIWSRLSAKYSESECCKIWYTEFPKFSRYNMGLHKLKEMAKQDNPEEFKKIININKQKFFKKWLVEHVKESHIKNLSIHTLSKNIQNYIKDYASFNIACACPAPNTTWYKFDKHKWTEDKAANKIYMLMTDDLYKELLNFFNEMKEQITKDTKKTQAQQEEEQPEDSEYSFMHHLKDDRPTSQTVEEQAQQEFKNAQDKLCLAKCGAILDFLSTPINKKKIIEDLSQKCFDEEFYKNLDENRDIMICNNGVLDLDTCRFRNGEPDDMMTISCKIDFPKNVDSLEAQEILHSIQDWLDKIFPDDQIQEYILNIFACKLSGKLFGEKFLIFTGSGANGKSQFFKFMSKVYGEYYQTFDNTLLNTPKRDANGPSPAVAKLKGCRIAVTTEPKGGQPFESDKVKELVSGDELTGRHLNKDPITFIPQYRMILQCNDIPKNDSTDDGFWRKIFVIPCDAKFVIKEEDNYKINNPDFPHHFKGQDQEHLYPDWAPYFLYMLFERFKALKENNFEFTTPDRVKLATREYQNEASTYTQFFDEKIEEAPGFKVDLQTLYTEFQLFVGRDFKPQKSTFQKQMERYIKKPKGIKKEYCGFRLRGTSGESIEENDEA
jgi:P4 family phage/plasmid primase-like protien